MEVVGDADGDHVDLGHFEELFIVLEGVGDGPFLGEAGGVTWGWGGDGEQVGLGAMAQGFGVDGGDEAGADDTDLDGFGHKEQWGE